MAIAMRLRNQLQSVYKLDPLRNELLISSTVHIKLRSSCDSVVSSEKRYFFRFNVTTEVMVSSPAPPPKCLMS
ncbi:hypothetical protein GOODEAATRI_025906 [Goodea atripinnis]|uniref:Uncharacterized protein n=1 Tax=Goodea atripinnis TaxID=208336 RepID=A0ABV0N7L0_9TELE